MELPELAQGGALGVLLIIVWKLLDALLASRSRRINGNGVKDDLKLLRVISAIEKMGDGIVAELKEIRQAVHNWERDK